MMELQQLKSIVEAALLAAEQPLSIERLAELFIEEEATHESIKQALALLQEDYAQRAIEIKQVASGYRIQVKQNCAPWVSRLWEEKPTRYSRALLETLVLIAYRQPITRAEIEEIRGVVVSTQIIRTLLEREWVRIVGHKEVPGRPALYATTKQFLDYFNLKHLHELPPLAEVRDLDKVEENLNLVEQESEQNELPIQNDEARAITSSMFKTEEDPNWQPQFLTEADLEKELAADAVNEKIEALLSNRVEA